jgi:hypothetical protein
LVGQRERVKKTDRGLVRRSPIANTYIHTQTHSTLMMLTKGNGESGLDT